MSVIQGFGRNFINIKPYQKIIDSLFKEKNSLGYTFELLSKAMFGPTYTHPKTNHAWPHFLTSKFGMREIAKLSKNPHFHYGLDLVPRDSQTGEIANNSKFKIMPLAAGEVVFSGFDSKGGKGFHVIIKHPNNTYTMYAHLQPHGLPKTGTKADRETAIGFMGNTGRSTKAHVHFELRINENTSTAAIDPLSELGAKYIAELCEPDNNKQMIDEALNYLSILSKNVRDYLFG